MAVICRLASTPLPWVLVRASEGPGFDSQLDPCGFFFSIFKAYIKTILFSLGVMWRGACLHVASGGNRLMFLEGTARQGYYLELLFSLGVMWRGACLSV